MKNIKNSILKSRYIDDNKTNKIERIKNNCIKLEEYELEKQKEKHINNYNKEEEFIIKQHNGQLEKINK